MSARDERRRVLVGGERRQRKVGVSRNGLSPLLTLRTDLEEAT